MRTKTRSVLIKTSVTSDVSHSGGSLFITGLPEAIKYSDILSFKNIKQRAETPRVSRLTIVGATAPTANTKYTIEIVDPMRKGEGWTGYLRKYSYKTPAVLTTIGATAALQNEYIVTKLLTQINADTSNYVLGATVGSGNGFTLTDDAGYYPARLNGASGGRLGTTNIVAVTNTDGSGFTQSQIADTTVAVYSFGDGSRMAQDIPVLHGYSGNVISGEITAPQATDGTYATPGQLYDAFFITSLCQQSAHAVTDQIAHALQTDIIFVDNGLGSATTNRAAFLIFQRAMLREIWMRYRENIKAIYSTFDNGVTYATLTGLSVIPTTALAENTINVGKGETFSFSPLVVATSAAVAAPRIDATNGGLNIAIDAASGKSSEISAELSVMSNREYIIGKDVFSLYVRVYVDDVSGVNPFVAGFRKKEAYEAALATYTDYSAIGIVGTTGKIQSATQVASGGQTTTDTTLVWADTETHELEVRVDINGVTTWFVDGKPKNIGTAYTFTAGLAVIPFVNELQTADVAANVSIREFASLPSANWRQ